MPWLESAHDSSSISKTWIDSTYDSTGFPGFDWESTHDSSGFPRYWFRLTRDSKCFPIFSIQINPWLKRKASDSESTHDSTLNHTHVCMAELLNHGTSTNAWSFRIQCGRVLFFLSSAFSLFCWIRPSVCSNHCRFVGCRIRTTSARPGMMRASWDGRQKSERTKKTDWHTGFASSRSVSGGRVSYCRSLIY